MEDVSIKSFVLIVCVIFAIGIVHAQDTLYIYKAGVVVNKRAVSQIDSITYEPPAIPTEGTLTDIDGNVYHWITIGTQKWMVENLKTTRFRTGESISNVTDGSTWSTITFAAWCDNFNSQNYGVKFGHLYNWYAVSDVRNIAPVGWHVPSDSEWTVLETYLITHGYNYDGTTSDNKIGKAMASQTDWSSSSGMGAVGNDLSKNNTSGFTGLPGGYRFYEGSFSLYIGTWWSATEEGLLGARYVYLDNSDAKLNRSLYHKRNGYSVRCVKD